MPFASKINKRFLTSGLTVALILSFFVAGYTYGQSGLPTVTLSGGPFPGAPTYTIFANGANYYYKDQYGATSPASTNASYIFNYVVQLSTSGAKIYITKGTYTSLYIDIINSNLEIYGDGRDATILTGTTGKSIFYHTNTNTPVSNIYIHDLTLSGLYNGATGAYKLINTQKASGTGTITFNNLKVEGVKLICLTQEISFHAGNVAGLTVRDCEFTTTYDNHDMLAFDGTEIVVDANTFTKTTTEGGYILTSGGGSHIKITKNTINCTAAVGGAWSAGISMEDYAEFYDVIISENSLINCAINIGGGGALSGSDFYGIQVLHNNLDGGFIGLYFTAGGELFNPEIIGNTIYKVALNTAFTMFGSISNATITNNNFINGSYVSFDGGGGFDNIHFSDNIGFVTERWGTGTIIGGTSIVVASGLSGYPSGITITPIDSGTGVVYVSDMSSNGNFTINTTNSGTFTLYWNAQYNPYP